jgi:hypothetical protein
MKKNFSKISIMTNFLQKSLGIEEATFRNGIKILERSTGNSGVDSRLIADMHENAHRVMRILKLDTTDTTGRELYHSLITSIKHRDRNIEALLVDTDYVLYIIDGKVISFNLIDVIENAHHELPYDKQIISHGQRSLRGEIIGRYINHTRTNEATTLETLSSIGLLSESDAWYNNSKAYKKQVF